MCLNISLVKFLVFTIAIHCCTSQLLVNIRSQLGEILKENFITNTTEDSVMMEFQLSDGTHVMKAMDFKHKLQIVRIIVLGEEELGQKLFQAFCFVFQLTKGDFITSDAMSKLRQKNPRTIRYAETDDGIEMFNADLTVHVELSGILSPHIANICVDAPSTTYASEKDLKKWANLKSESDWDWTAVMEITQRIPTNLDACEIDENVSSPCICSYQVMMPWYPCGLKYCKGKDTAGKAVSYRCGIKTCRKQYRFSFYLPHNKNSCIRNTEINVPD